MTPAGNPAAITAFTGTTTLISTTARPHSLVANEFVTISGTDSTLNGTTVSVLSTPAPTTTTFAFANTDPRPSAGGTETSGRGVARSEERRVGKECRSRW